MKKIWILFLLSIGVSTVCRAQEKLTAQMVYDNLISVRNLSGKPMPPFSAVTIAGKKFDITQLQGNVIVFCVWNTNCGPCIDEINSFKDLQDKYIDRKVSFIAITPVDNIRDIKRFLKAHTFNFDIIYSPSSNFVKDYGAYAYPTSYVIDRQGVIRYAEVGYDKDNVKNITSVVEKYL